jgi:hypothetical protein
VRRVALAPTTSRAVFGDAARARGWGLAHVVDTPDGSHPYEEIWLTPDERTALHFMEDDMVGVLYALVDGERPEHYSAQLEEELETVSAARAAACLRGAADPQERVAAVSHLAVAADPRVPDDDSLSAYRDALADDDPEVRSAAAIGAAYLVWPELLAPLDTLAAGDPDEKVRRWAVQGAAALRTNLEAEAT